MKKCHSIHHLSFEDSIHRCTVTKTTPQQQHCQSKCASGSAARQGRGRLSLVSGVRHCGRTRNGSLLSAHTRHSHSPHAPESHTTVESVESTCTKCRVAQRTVHGSLAFTPPSRVLSGAIVFVISISECYVIFVCPSVCLTVARLSRSRGRAQVRPCAHI